MRSRKAAAAVVEELPPAEEPIDAIPPDDTAADEPSSAVREPLALDLICIDCGSSGRGHDGCAHRERARFHAPPRAALELVARLRRAAAEHRAAARALRALVTAEHARGRAEIERADPVEPQPEAAPEPPSPPRLEIAAPEPPAPPAVCPRCAEQTEGEPAESGAPPRRPKRKGRVALEQQAFLFSSDSEQRSPHGT
ncbi:hypothetical protein WMF27_07265 [Sorangium sp. So ce281]|uniref:hypothetical protein n=1 Tax=unclassified Sorangium TaxID=2621164 RepID=UPI003F6102F4